MSLVQRGSLELPHHNAGGFDHADVHLCTGRVFIAHTADGTVEVVDGATLRHLKTLPDCPEASGVLCAQAEGLICAAARGAGHVLVTDAETLVTVRTIQVGPDRTAWLGIPITGGSWSQTLPENSARLVDPTTGNQSLRHICLDGPVGASTTGPEILS
jgi:hypothetical protein